MRTGIDHEIVYERATVKPGFAANLLDRLARHKPANRRNSARNARPNRAVEPAIHRCTSADGFFLKKTIGL